MSRRSFGLLTTLRTKQGALVLIVTATVLLGAGFGFLAPMGGTAGDGQTTGTNEPLQTTPTATPLPTATSATATPSTQTDDGSASNDGDSVGSDDTNDTPTATATPDNAASAPESAEKPNPSSSSSPSSSADDTDNADETDDAHNEGGSDTGAKTETLDLRLALQDGHALVDVGNALPGQTGTSSVSVRNAGSLDGSLTTDVTVSAAHENGMTEPERHVDDSPKQGELGEWLSLRISLASTGNQDRQYLVGNADSYVSLSELDETAQTTPVSLPSRTERILFVEWCIGSDAGNEIQTDSIRLALDLSLVQS